MYYYYKYRKYMVLIFLKGINKRFFLNKEKVINKENSSLFRNWIRMLIGKERIVEDGVIEDGEEVDYVIGRGGVNVWLLMMRYGFGLM